MARKLETKIPDWAAIVRVPASGGPASQFGYYIAKAGPDTPEKFKGERRIQERPTEAILN